LSVQRIEKKQTITAVNDAIVGHKHPEDEHHENCMPLQEHEIAAQTADRQVREDVREHGQ